MPRMLPPCTVPRRSKSLSHLPNKQKKHKNSKTCLVHFDKNLKKKMWIFIERLIQSKRSDKNKTMLFYIKLTEKWLTFGNVLDFTRGRVEKEPFRYFLLLLLAKLCFFVCHFLCLSLSPSLIWNGNEFEEEAEGGRRKSTLIPCDAFHRMDASGP